MATVRVRFTEFPVEAKVQDLQVGLLLVSGEMQARVSLMGMREPNAQLECDLEVEYYEPGSIARHSARLRQSEVLEPAAVSIRLARQGNVLRSAYTTNGVSWEESIQSRFTGEMANTIRLGVFARWSGKTEARAVLDKFELTAQ